MMLQMAQRIGIPFVLLFFAANYYLEVSAGKAQDTMLIKPVFFLMVILFCINAATNLRSILKARGQRSSAREEKASLKKFCALPVWPSSSSPRCRSRGSLSHPLFFSSPLSCCSEWKARPFCFSRLQPSPSPYTGFLCIFSAWSCLPALSVYENAFFPVLRERAGKNAGHMLLASL